MGDQEFLRLLDDYLDPPGDPNPAMAEAQIIWVRGNPHFGARHIWDEHRVAETEVVEVLLEVPPFVEEKRHPDLSDRTIFWGATRGDRWLLVVCEDWTEAGTRFLRPITAFEPDDGTRYWESFR